MGSTKSFTFWQWRVLLLAALFYCFVYLGRLNWALAAPDLISQLHLSKADIGMGAAAVLWGYAFGQGVNGRLADRFGGRGWATLGAFGTIAANLLISVLNYLPAMIVLLAINGFFQAMIFPSVMQITAQWWPSRMRGFQTGFMVAAAGTSSVVTFAISGWFVANYGWQSAFRYPMLLVFIFALVYFFFVRERPEDVGLEPYEETRDDVAKRETVLDSQLLGLGIYWYLVRQKEFLITCFLGFLYAVGRYGLLTWIPLYYVQTSGLAMKSVIWSQIGLPIGMALGPLLTGLISDQLFGARRWQTLMIGFAGSAICFFALAFEPISALDTPSMFAVLIASGFFVHSMAGGTHSLAGDVGGRKMQGTAQGVLGLCNYFGAGLQGIVIGVILDRSGNNWAFVFSLIGGLLFLGAALSIVTDRQPRVAVQSSQVSLTN